ncbi:MAG: YitT family protein [Amphritea sp.]
MNQPKWASDALLVVVGSICFAFGIVAFLMPLRIVAGGPPGIAVLLNHLADFSPGLVILVVNAALMVLGLRSLGAKYLLRTLATVVLIALLTESFLFALGDTVITEDRLLNALCAGVFLGAGLGLIFKGGSASGGWAILVRLIADRANIKIGQTAVFLDATVVLTAAIVFRDYESALLGGVAVFISGRVIDQILSDPRRVQQVYVSSPLAGELKAIIDTQFGIQGTMIRCDTTSSSTDEGLLYLSIERRHLNTLKRLIEKEAPDAVVTVTNAMNVMGSR